MILILAMLAACEGGAGDGDGYTLVGTVEAAGSTADVRNAKAFGVNTGGKAAVLVVPNPDATCDDAATYLSGPSGDWNPEVVNGVGVCNLYVYLPEYAGDTTIQDDAAAATVVLNCAMDDGTWIYEERDDGDVGYYYDGPWWIGSPDGFELSLSGGDDEDFALSVAMDAYNGSFTYDVENPDPDPGTGAVAGETVAEWCPDMGPTLAR